MFWFIRLPTNTPFFPLWMCQVPPSASWVGKLSASPAIGAALVLSQLLPCISLEGGNVQLVWSNVSVAGYSTPCLCCHLFSRGNEAKYSHTIPRKFTTSFKTQIVKLPRKWCCPSQGFHPDASPGSQIGRPTHPLHLMEAVSGLGPSRGRERAWQMSNCITLPQDTGKRWGGGEEWA